MIFVYDKNKTDKLLSDKVSITQDVQDNGKYLGIENGKVVPKNITTPPQTELMIETTYANLVSLRNNSQLIPGQQYRITDYQTIINGDVTYNGVTKTLYRSAGHQFDIIVTADSENTLNENARAIQHDGDTYFANSDLSAWKLKYCIDNDTSRFNLAIPSGKGVIWGLEDEHHNYCGYDFKNLQIKIFKVSAHTTNSNYINKYVGRYTLFGGSYAITPTNSTFNESDFKWVYTFTVVDDTNWATITDASTIRISGGYTYSHNYCDGIDKNSLAVSPNVFINYKNVSKGNTLKGNSVGNFFVGLYCSSLTADYFYRNTFGYEVTTANGYFSNITFGESCNNNMIGHGYISNSLGNNCYNNLFGNYCNDNSFDNDCYNNVLKDNVNRISLGNRCRDNQFEAGVVLCSFENGCHSNSIDAGSYDIHLGDENADNTFSSNNKRIDFSQLCHNNILNDSCENIMLSTNCYSNTFNANVKNVNVAKFKASTTFTTAQNNSVITS